MKHILICALTLLPLPVLAQEDDKGWLSNWLEENLSGAGRQVVIDGFQGALSSQARIERLEQTGDEARNRLWESYELTVQTAQAWRKAHPDAERVEAVIGTAMSPADVADFIRRTDNID